MVACRAADNEQAVHHKRQDEREVALIGASHEALKHRVHIAHHRSGSGVYRASGALEKRTGRAIVARPTESPALESIRRLSSYHGNREQPPPRVISPLTGLVLLNGWAVSATLTSTC